MLENNKKFEWSLDGKNLKNRSVLCEIAEGFVLIHINQGEEIMRTTIASSYKIAINRPHPIQLFYLFTTKITRTMWHIIWFIGLLLF